MDENKPTKKPASKSLVITGVILIGLWLLASAPWKETNQEFSLIIFIMDWFLEIFYFPVLIVGIIFLWVGLVRMLHAHWDKKKEIISTIGTVDESINYTDRPTVKVIIKKDNSVLILNDGLLPGGGVDANETDLDAITRELKEELGATVIDAERVGMVIQYRNFLHRRYVIHGYIATLASIGGLPTPQDTGEAHFTHTWLSIDDALRLVANSIVIAKTKSMDSDANQGKLYNLMTTYELLKRL